MTQLTKTFSGALIFGLSMSSIAIAQTGCVTATDLDTTGIVFETGGGYYEVHTRQPGGEVLLQFFEGKDNYSQQTYYNGVHILNQYSVTNGQIDPDGQWSWQYPMALADLPLPTPGGKVFIDATNAVDGSYERETAAHVFGQMSSVNLGGCQYDYIPVVITFDGETYDHIEEHWYFPALGTGVLMVWDDENGRDEYTLDGIRRF